MGGAGMPAWVMSHPKTDERIAAIEALEARWSRELPGE
jgi:putative metalloprotease